MSISTEQSEIIRLNKIIQALVKRAEQNAAVQNSDFTLFHTAITLEDQVRRRTIELETALRENERMTHALQESEEKNRLLIENSPYCIHELDIEGRIISMNNAGLRMLGMEEESEILGTPFLQAVDAKDRNRLSSMLANAQAGLSCDFEFTSNFPSRSIFKSCLIPIKNATGQVIRLMGITEDITLRHRVEKFETFRTRILELLAHQVPLREILEAIVIGVEQLNPEMLCSILLLDHEGCHLRGGSAPSLPDFYNTAIDGVAIGVGVGSCGTAAFTGERVVVEEIAKHPYWAPYKELAAKAGLAACWSQPILSAGGRVMGTFAIYHQYPHTPTPSDIEVIEQAARLASIAMKHKEAEAKLLVSDFALKSISQGVVITGVDEKIVAVNDAFCAITGYQRDEVLGRNCRFLQGPESAPSTVDAIRKSIRNLTGISCEILNYRKDGRPFWNELSISPVWNSNGQLQNHIGITRDITERKQMEEQIRQFAFYDPLTKLANRRLLIDRLAQGLATSKRNGTYGAVIFLDLDNFKPLNDEYGHVVGDLLLIDVATRLRNCVREVDTVARFGGDEFVVLLNGLGMDQQDSLKQASVIAEKILYQLAQPYQLNVKQAEGQELTVVHQCSASLGIAMFINQSSLDDLLNAADSAMYLAKQHGRNQIRFYEA